MYRLIIFVLLAVMLSCSSEEPAKTAAPETPKPAPKVEPRAEPTEAAKEAPMGKYSLSIIPGEARRDTVLMLKAEGFSLEGLRVDWFINGMESFNATGPEIDLSTEQVSKGSEIQARVRLEDQEVYSNTITLLNSKPEVKDVRIMPEVFQVGDVVHVEATPYDPDNDPVMLSYEWTKNDIPAGLTKNISVLLRRGDKFSVLVTPFDGEEKGQPVLLHREIKNMPPVFADTSEYKYSFDGQNYSYQVRATDPDMDTITYSIKSGPKDMTVDPSSGYIKWAVPADFSGTQSFTVSATDGQGGEAIQELKVTIKFEKETEGAGKKQTEGSEQQPKY